ncbi:MAG: hypothetical protein AAF716_20090 [Cyanobacteria bacterium P01_D01_bin.1]
MVKASGQIEKELGLLQQRTEDMAIALDPIYDGYLGALADASKQQLMSAVYHLCTQAYPDKFLKLSWKERSKLQQTLQTLTAQIRPQLDEQRTRAKKMSRRPQRNNGLDFLQRLLESRTAGAVIHAREGTSEDLLEKLSALAQSDRSQSDKSQSDKHPDPRFDSDAEQYKREQHKSSSSKNEQPSDTDELGPTEDWEDDIPAAEEYDEVDDASESLFLRHKQGRDSASRGDAISAVDLENMDFPESDLEDDDDDDELDFDIDVPAAEQRLTIAEEEDLLSALEGLAGRSATADDSSEDESEQPLAPIHLFKQQMLMEKGIRDVFRTLSDEINELLQKASVMPSFPKALMAAATDPQGIGEPVNAVPNVVRVSVRVMHGQINTDSEGMDDGRPALSESTRDERRRSRSKRRQPKPGQSKPGQSKRRHSSRSRSNRADVSRLEIPHDIVEIEALPELALVSLQLSEVAFSDPTVSAWRTRLRKELSTLKRLGNHYAKTQRSLETAQAEDAWRSSWMAADSD